MPPGGDKEEKKKSGIQGIARIGIAKSENDVAPVNKTERKNRFNFDPSAGRDYAADAPADKRPVSAQSKDSKKNENKPVPIKSPAQVAAEKAEEWKR